MKNIFRGYVLWLLRKMAKHRLKKFKGKIIAVTGSVGKTSTKEAIFKVLNTQFKVKRSKKSMNSDFGMLLTILDINTGFSSATKWLWYLGKAFLNSLTRDYSEILLLEMGVDKPGDMDFLLDIIKPDIAVFTNVFPVHLAEGQFDSVDEVFNEKSKLINSLKEGGTAVLNIDNEDILKLSKRCPKRRVLTYGVNKDALYRIGRVDMSVDGIKYSIFHKDKRIVVESLLLGDYQSYILTPAYICAEALGMEPEQILHVLGDFQLPPGRMNPIDGIDNIKILDSSYNSSPEALISALGVLGDVAEGRRRVAVLGQMNELGEKSEELHLAVGKVVPKYADVLISVAGDAKYLAQVAVEKGMSEKNVHFFNNVKEAIDFYKTEIKENDLVLVKGSQNRVRLERFVKEFMLNPEDAKELLVRQDKEWQAKL